MAVAERTAGVLVEGLDVSAYTVPTDAPESDGTLEWDSTTIVVVEAHAGGETGLGYTYGLAATGAVVEEQLAEIVRGTDPDAVEETWEAMGAALRNAGRPGIGFMALAAVDVALWDLRSRIHGRSLADLLDAPHETVPVYGSGGFTSYSLERLAGQLGRWVEQGIPRVKLKIGTRPEDDPARLDAVRRAIGDDAELYVDANGAFTREEAVAWAARYRAGWEVSWFEEPVSSEDLEDLRIVREGAPEGLEIAAGEYGYVLRDFLGLLEPRAVDCLQIDVTRAGGITGTLRAARAAADRGLDVSAHCAPAISAHAFAAAPNRRHLEYFHDHVRVEEMLLDGLPSLECGELRPDRSRPGHGLELRRADAERFRVEVAA